MSVRGHVREVTNIIDYVCVRLDITVSLFVHEDHLPAPNIGDQIVISSWSANPEFTINGIIAKPTY